MSRKIAIITARAGSKRIPSKNIKDFLGRPIIEYSISAALSSKIFDMVLVSTDCQKIADIAKNAGAIVPFYRSAQNSDDHSTTVDVLLEVINSLKIKKEEFEYGCCIYPTAPFVTSKKIIDSFECLIESGQDNLIPVCEFRSPPQRAFEMNQDKKIKMLYQEFGKSRSQDLTKAYHDVGQFYWFKIDSLLTQETVFTDKTIGYPIPEMESQDIDTPEDWEIAEFKYRYMNKMI